MNQTNTRIWEEDYVIPTYKVYPPEKNPLFMEKRAYQGSTGKVYPLPVTEKISDEKEDVSYRAVFLENEYLKVMVLPELGGRIQRAYDKTNGYDFVYYNHVIKPALVGLTGDVYKRQGCADLDLDSNAASGYQRKSRKTNTFVGRLGCGWIKD